MPRSLLVFGNGLGMSLDPAYFRLQAGLAHAWNDNDIFAPEHKRLVASAIPGVDLQAYPREEEQLDQLQMALVASDFLQSFETEDVQWLTEQSRQLPNAFRRFIHAAATYFHRSGQNLPEAFVESLAAYVEETKSHVALLNYDNLLYDALRDRGILRGYAGALLDGFHNEGFNPEHLDRFNTVRHGWYLHLHGSPLFVGNRKIMGIGREFLHPTEQCHVVLTHVQHKRSIIDKSSILSEYWNRLRKTLSEASQIILFGYSGADVHLNEIIASNSDGKPVFVVEWDGAGEFRERKSYWESKLKNANVTLVTMGNILEFEDWSAPNA